MFHWTNNLFFGRRSDKSVRILKFRAVPSIWPAADNEYSNDATDLDVTIPANEWASIVASVSYAGESDGRWNQALEFHNGKIPGTNHVPVEPIMITESETA
jgi:hypothetical protein